MVNEEVPDNILEDKNFIKNAIFTGSRCAWGFLGGMICLMFMTENLYLENNMYPYAAKLAGLAAFIIGVIFDAIYKSMKGS